MNEQLVFGIYCSIECCSVKNRTMIRQLKINNSQHLFTDPGRSQFAQLSFSVDD